MNECVKKETDNCLRITSEFILILIIAWMLVLAANATCFASTVAIQWDPDTVAGLSGYKVYYQTDSSVQPFVGMGATQGNSPVAVDKLQTTANIGGLDPAHAYYFAVTAYDASGVESVYSNIVYVPELVSPTISISSPSNNAAVNGTVSIAANASDNVGVTKVEFYVNGTLRATDTATPYVYSWNTLSVAAGAYTLMAKAYDAAGNVGQSSTVAVVVVNDTTAPVIALTAPGNSSTVNGTVAITASVSDNIGVSKVEFYENSVLLFASNVAPYTYNWDTTSIVNGSYSLTAKAYDNAGNIGQSPSISVTVFNDTSAPTVTAFTLPATASSTTVPVSIFTATDNAGVTGYLITESATAPAASATSWTDSAPASFTFSSAGSKTAYAWVKDAASNVSSSRSASVTITLSDTTAPTVSVTSPSSSATVSGIVSVTTSAFDNIGVTKVEFYVNGALQSTATAAPYSFSWNTSVLANGSYSLSAKAYDAAGKAGQSTAISVTVNNIAFDTTPPIVAINSPSAGAKVGSSVTIKASATDNVAAVKMQLYVDGMLKTTVNASALSWTWRTTNYAKGSHVIKVTAYDAANNSSSQSKTVYK